MPIDDMMLNPMLDPFRNMAKECEEKGYSGEEMDRMMAALNKMEEMGQEMDDFGAFSAQLTSEGLQMEFSNAYSQVLAGAAQQSQSSSEGGYDDAALLKTTLDALRDSVKRLREGKVEAIQEAASKAESAQQADVTSNEIDSLFNQEALIEPIEALIQYGESGVNYPTFLRVQIEKGLDKAMEGSAVMREGLEYLKGWAEADRVNPFEIKKANEKLEAFDAMAQAQKFGVPDSIQFQLKSDQIDHHYLPAIAQWDGIRNAWERILSQLITWSYAHMSFADQIFPWSAMSNPQPAIQRTKDTYPGEIKERLRILKENFGLEFHDIFHHETFIWQVENHLLDESQIWIEKLIHDIYPQCQPGNYLKAETVSEVERFYKEHLMANPERHKALERSQQYYDQVFGAGMYAKKFPQKADWGTRNAEPWDLSTFDARAK